LPGQAKFILEPSAPRFLAAVCGQLVPEVIHFLLGLDTDEERDGFVELLFRATVERVELLSLELEARHEVVDDFHLGVRKNRLIERNGLRNVVVKPEEGRGSKS
jgi:hypothetical protein